MQRNNSIDIIITWVDSKDPNWLKEYKKYSKNKIIVRKQYEDLGTLKYLFRGIEKFMPWVRKIHFVTFGHYPKWLNINHPKINIVKHIDIFPDASVLPVFNSAAIEMNFHYIKELSERFIYFNDDMFVLKPLTSNYFFTNNLPNDFFIIKNLFHDGIFSHRLHTIMEVINKEIKKTNSKKKQIKKILTLKYGIKSLIKSLLIILLFKEILLFELFHLPQPHLKCNFFEVEKNYKNVIERTRKNKFRHPLDVNQYIFRFWGLIKGRFFPKLYKNAYYIPVNDINKLKDDLKKLKNISPSPALICFNEENFDYRYYKEYKELLMSFFEEILPNKCNYEI